MFVRTDEGWAPTVVIEYDGELTRKRKAYLLREHRSKIRQMPEGRERRLANVGTIIFMPRGTIMKTENGDMGFSVNGKHVWLAGKNGWLGGRGRGLGALL